MAKPRAHLRHAPIVEALIDFKVLRTDKVPPDIFGTARSAVGSNYGEMSPIESIEARFGLNQGRGIDSGSVRSSLGVAFKAEDAVVQFRVDGFTFNKLEPYTTWEEVFAEAIRLWDIYVQSARPAEVSRLAVRYINRLRMPGPTDLREFLEAPPVLPPPIPQHVREFLTRVIVEDHERNASAVIVQALEASFDPAIVPLLLDIDAFRHVSLPVDDPSIREIFQALRELKNDIFYASVTERTVETYE